MRQRLQHLGDGSLRQPGLGRDRRGGDLTIREGREVGGDDDAVIGELAEDDHRIARAGSIRTNSVRYRSSPQPAGSSAKAGAVTKDVAKPPSGSARARIIRMSRIPAAGADAYRHGRRPKQSRHPKVPACVKNPDSLGSDISAATQDHAEAQQGAAKQSQARGLGHAYRRGSEEEPTKSGGKLRKAVPGAEGEG